MSRKLSFPCSAKYVYTMLKMNRYLLHEEVGITCATVASGFNSSESISLEKETPFYESEPTPNSPNNSPSSSESNLSNNSASASQAIVFRIVLTEQEWKSLRPKPIAYKRSDTVISTRNYSTFPPYLWTHIFSEHFYENTSLQCTLSFKRCKILGSPDCIIISASCSV